MMALLVQLSVIGIWGTMLVVHTRRLFRLAQFQTMDSLRNHPLRQRFDRLWWWLGREEFWHTVQRDCLRCVQLTLMLFMLAWGLMR
ncbi:MAG: hypothetical protein H7Z42_19035 [Roseiflexaceae bacterium]|nr:hypothetical protein [Roseiflexaceae bacterium]